MKRFATFNPILEGVRNGARKYYEENNLELPDNEYFKRFYIARPEEEAPSEDKYTVNVKGKKKKVDDLYQPVDFTKFIKKDESPKPIPPTVFNSIQKEIYGLEIPEEDKSYLDRLAALESSYRPHITNRLGYYGLYQFGDQALDEVGYTKKDFDNTINQHLAALSLARKNQAYLGEYFNKSIGKVINGVKVTRNGLLAAAHLVGASAVKQWLKNPNIVKADANGTKIEDYLEKFA